MVMLNIRTPTDSFGIQCDDNKYHIITNIVKHIYDKCDIWTQRNKKSQFKPFQTIFRILRYKQTADKSILLKYLLAITIRTHILLLCTYVYVYGIS